MSWDKPEIKKNGVVYYEIGIEYKKMFPETRAAPLGAVFYMLIEAEKRKLPKGGHHEPY